MSSSLPSTFIMPEVSVASSTPSTITKNYNKKMDQIKEINENLKIEVALEENKVAHNEDRKVDEEINKRLKLLQKYKASQDKPELFLIDSTPSIVSTTTRRFNKLQKKTAIKEPLKQ